MCPKSPQTGQKAWKTVRQCLKQRVFPSRYIRSYITMPRGNPCIDRHAKAAAKGVDTPPRQSPKQIPICFQCKATTDRLSRHSGRQPGTRSARPVPCALCSVLCALCPLPSALCPPPCRQGNAGSPGREARCFSQSPPNHHAPYAAAQTTTAAASPGWRCATSPISNTCSPASVSAFVTAATSAGATASTMPMPQLNTRCISA